MVRAAPIKLGAIGTVGTVGGVPRVVITPPSAILMPLLIGSVSDARLTTGAIHLLWGSGDSPIHTNLDGRELDVLIDDGEVPFRMGSRDRLLVHLGHHG
jgi:hypothetical protein